MSNTQGIQIKVEADVLELSVVVASDVLDLDALVRHGTIGKASEVILHFSLVEDYMHPSKVVGVGIRSRVNFPQTESSRKIESWNRGFY